MTDEAGHAALDEEWLARLAPTPEPERSPAPFRVPWLVQRALQKKEIEWPIGSGRTALYSDAERAVVTEVLASGSPTAANEVAVLHELKVEFDGLLREPTGAEEWDEWIRAQ